MVAQLVKNLSSMQETLVRFLGWEDTLEEGMETHNNYGCDWKMLQKQSLEDVELWLKLLYSVQRPISYLYAELFSLREEEAAGWWEIEPLSDRPLLSPGFRR